MATYHVPEFDRLTKDFAAKMKEHLANIEDLGAALDGATDPVAVIDDWEARAATLAKAR